MNIRRAITRAFTRHKTLTDQSDKRVERLSMLTARERQIVNLVSEGLSNKAIARQLKLTDGTIKVHLHHVFEKLGISNRTSLAALAIGQEGRT